MIINTVFWMCCATNSIFFVYSLAHWHPQSIMWSIGNSEQFLIWQCSHQFSIKMHKINFYRRTHCARQIVAFTCTRVHFVTQKKKKEKENDFTPAHECISSGDMLKRVHIIISPIFYVLSITFSIGEGKKTRAAKMETASSHGSRIRMISLNWALRD